MQNCFFLLPAGMYIDSYSSKSGRGRVRDDQGVIRFEALIIHEKEVKSAISSAEGGWGGGGRTE